MEHEMGLVLVVDQRHSRFRPVKLLDELQSISSWAILGSRNSM